MKNYPKYVKSTLNTVIRDMSKHPEDFCSRPGKDFTRKRKLPFGFFSCTGTENIVP